MVFRVCLLANGEYRKTFHRCMTRETAFKNFHRIKNENNVLFPKKFVNTRKIKPIKYEICVTKPTEEGDKFRLLRDEFGKTYVEKPLGDWTILHSEEYFIEEEFMIYDINVNKKKGTIKDIVKIITANAYAKKMVKQVIVVYNKLLIYNEDLFDLVICKNIDDAQRLHHALAKAAKKQKIKSVMFMGTASKASVTRMYQLIKDRTGWNILKIKRTTTRP
jgi:hypothetical protein